MIEGLGTKLKVRGMAASSPRSKAHCMRERELATPSSVVPNPPPGWSGNELEKAIMMRTQEMISSLVPVQK